MRLSFVVLNTKHSKSGDIEEEMFANYQDSLPRGSPGLYWTMLLAKYVALGGNKTRLHYSRMKKQSRKLAAVKRVTCTYEDALSGYFLFSCFDSHGYREIFSSAGERAGLSEMIKWRVTTLQNKVDKRGARRLLRPQKYKINQLQTAATVCPQDQNVTSFPREFSCIRV